MEDHLGLISTFLKIRTKEVQTDRLFEKEDQIIFLDIYRQRREVERLLEYNLRKIILFLN